MTNLILRSKVEVYVPGTVNVDIVVDTNYYVDKTAEKFCEWFGGATTEPSNGYWKATNGKVVIEPITRVWAYCSTNQLEAHIGHVYEWAETICKELHQEAVSLVVNEQLHLVGADSTR